MRSINRILLCPASGDSPPSFMTKERAAALEELERKSLFQPHRDSKAPYDLTLKVVDGRIAFDITNAAQEKLPALILSLNPYRRLIRDYFMMIRSYETLRSQGNMAKLEAVDMGRRGLHNEAADMMMTRLEDTIEMDLDTARRLFTLICALHSESRLWR